MSTTVDERVVEMRFDNKQFESNVATSMSTLDKLKQKLNLSGASKGLEDIDKASKKVNMSGLSGAVDAVSAKFSALQVIGITALANITNSAVNAGKHMISALTIDPVKTGLKEYETQINAVQTILANTSSKGTTIDQVNAALDELNKYADLTIYNFTEMTRNIGTFTAAGIDLETSVSAIQGIANLAAVSGSTSQQASLAMYQLSQALASGTVKLMDWNSVVNAGMGGEVFQNALKETSKLLGTGAEASIKANGSFRESLSTGWLTSEVLTETLKKFTTSGANEYVAKYTGLSVEAVEATLKNAEAQYEEAEAIDKAAEELAAKSGKSKDEIKATLQMAKTAQDAATKVKTFSQLWDTMKEAAQSGWAKTWQIIIGDFEEAKSLLTPLSDFFNNIIGKMSDWRNNLLESALGQGFAHLADKINGALKPATKAVDTVKKVTGALGDLDEIVNKVIRGDFGNGHDRFVALTEAGENYYKIQNKVNETLGNSFRYTDEQIDAQDKLVGKQKETTETIEESEKASVELTDAQKNELKLLAQMDEAQLRSKGYTDEQIEALKELGAQADKLGIPLGEFIDNIDEINGRWLLWNSFKNVGKALMQVFTSIGKAWREVFSPIQGEQIFNAIAAVHKFTASLIPSEETAKKLTKTFKGLFAALDIIKTILGGGIRVAFKILSSILSYFHLNIFDVTAAIGDALVAFHDWFDSIFDISGILDAIVPIIQKAANAIREWYDAFKETPAVQKLLTAIETIRSEFSKLTSGEINIGEFAASLGKGLAKAIKSLPGIALQIGKDFIAGFQNGIADSIGGVIRKVVDFCINFVSNFASALGVHSPSWKAYEIAQGFFQGFINGAKVAFSGVVKVLKTIGEQIVNVFKRLWDYITDENGYIEWDKIFAAGSIISMILILKKFVDTFDTFAGLIGSVSGLINQTSATMQNFGKVLSATAWDIKAEALKKMAISIGILAASVWLLATIDDPKKLRNAVGVIGALAAVLIILGAVMNKMSAVSLKWSKGPQIDGIKQGLLQIGIVILMLAAAVKLIGSMKAEEAKQGMIALAEIAVGMLVFMATIGRITRYSGDVADVGKMMKQLAVAMLLMVIVCKLAGSLSAEQMLKGAAFAAGFTIFVKYIVKATQSVGSDIKKVGSMMIKLAFAMALMVGVCKLAGLLTVEDMFKGANFAAGFVIFVAALVKVTKISNEQKIAKISLMITSISFAMLMLVGVCKLCSLLSVSEMIKGGIFMAGFLAFVSSLVQILKISNKQKMAEVSKTITAMAFGIAVLAGICVLLSFIDVGSLAKGIVAVGMLSAMMALMVHSLKGAKNAKEAMKWMMFSIVAIAGSVVALSFIDDKDFVKAVEAMATLMGMFAIMMRSLKGLTKVPVGPIIMMIGAIVALTGVMYLLGLLDPKSTIASVASLAILMLAMARVLKILSSMDADVKKAFKSAISLAMMVIPLIAFVGILYSMKNLKTSIKNVAALIILMTAMAGLAKLLDLMRIDALRAAEGAIALTTMALPMWVLIKVLKTMNGVENAMGNVKALAVLMSVLALLLLPLTLIGALIWPAILGIAALTAMAIPMIAFISIIKRMNGVENAENNINLLLGFMTTMTKLLTKIALVGPMALIGVTAMVGLTALMGIIGVFATAVGALMTKFPSLEKFLDKGLPVLEKIGGSIGKMIGNFVNGISTGIGNGLVKMGEDIAAFMAALSVASSNASGIKRGSFNGIEDLISVLLQLAGSAISTSIADLFTSLFSGQTSMEKFKSDAIAFFGAMKQIGKVSSDVSIDEKSFETIVKAAKSLADLQSSLQPIGGVISWFAGRTDLEAFGNSIVPFIRSMKMAFKVLDGVTIDEEAFNSVIVAAKALAELQSSLEPIGGVISWFKGRDDLATFGENVAQFIESMKMAFSTLKGVTLDLDAFECIITAATALAELQSSLEPIGGVISWFKGRDDLATFGENVAQFIESMKTALSTLDGITLDSAALDTVILATEKLAELQGVIEPIGGVIKWFTGRDDLGAFGASIVPFADGMKALGECSSVDPATIDTLVVASNKLSELQGSLERIGGVVDFFAGSNSLETFGNGVEAFATGMVTLSSCGTINLSTLENLVKSSAVLSELQSNLNRVGGVIDFFAGNQSLLQFGTGISAFADGMKKVSEVGPIDQVAFESINIAATSLSELQSNLDRVGGVAAFFAGDNDLGTFGENVRSFMVNMKTALGSISGITVDTAAFEAISTAATELSNLQGDLDRVGGVVAFFAGDNDLGTFGENVKTFMTNMKYALSALDGITLDDNAFKTVTQAVKDLSDLQKELESPNSIIKFFSGRTDLATFGQNVSLFADGMLKLEQCEGFKVSVMTSLTETASRLNEFQGKLDGTVGGVVNWFNGKKADLGTFGASISLFADGMLKLEQCEGFKISVITSLISSANQLNEFQGKLDGTVGGVVNWFKGKQADLGTFGANIETFANGFIKLKDCEALDPKVLDSITAAATKLGEFQSTLEMQVNPIIAFFAGERQSLGEFGADIDVFATAMTKLKECGGIKEEDITSIVSAGTAITEFQKILPTEHWFDGKMDLSEFSDYVSDFSTAMSEFSKSATEIDTAAVSTVISTAYRIKNFVDSLADFNTDGIEKFTGIGVGGVGADGPAYKIAKAIATFGDAVDDTDMQKVASTIACARQLRTMIEGLNGFDGSGVDNFKPQQIATEIKNYSDTIKDINSVLVASSINSAIKLKNFIATLTELDSSGIANFKIGSIGTSIKNYSANVSKVNLAQVVASVTAAESLKKFISGLATFNSDGVDSFKSSVEKLATVNTTGIVKAFNLASVKMIKSGSDMMTGLIRGMQLKIPQVMSTVNSLTKSIGQAISSKFTTFFDAGQKLAGKLIDGIAKKNSAAKTAGEDLASKASSGIKTKYDSFKNAGKYLGDGLVEGINAKQTAAYNAGYALGKKAVEGEKDGQQSNSPSKATIKAGKWLGEGLIIGIKNMGKSVYNAGENMGTTAINATRSAMTTMLDTLNSNMDAQPTIRPVVDLTDVRSGATAINGMFSGTRGIGIQGNLNAINVAMNRKLQNGSNNDVITAINKLNDGLVANRGDTYNFEGITYDNGNEISNAVQTLVRAAKMGRRV